MKKSSHIRRVVAFRSLDLLFFESLGARACSFNRKNPIGVKCPYDGGASLGRNDPWLTDRINTVDERASHISSRGAICPGMF